jgi:hypothetical protein
LVGHDLLHLHLCRPNLPKLLPVPLTPSGFGWEKFSCIWHLLSSWTHNNYKFLAGILKRMKNHWISELKYHTTSLRHRATVSICTKQMSCKKRETHSSRSKMYTLITCHTAPVRKYAHKYWAKYERHIETVMSYDACSDLTGRDTVTAILCVSCGACSGLTGWATDTDMLCVMQCVHWTEWLMYWHWSDICFLKSAVNWLSELLIFVCYVCVIEGMIRIELMCYW